MDASTQTLKTWVVRGTANDNKYTYVYTTWTFVFFRMSKIDYYD